MNQSARNGEKQYAIGAVVKLTGLTTHVIRVWEKRHEAVVASRLSSGRRVYNQDQVDRLLLLKKCTELGLTISAAAGLCDEELRSKIAELSSKVILKEGNLENANTQFSLGVLGPANLFKQSFEMPELDLVFHKEVTNWTQVHLQPELQELGTDILVLGVASLTSDSVASILEMMKRTCPKLMVLVYRFANKLSLSALRNQGIRLAKAPLDEESLASIMSEFFERIGQRLAFKIPQPSVDYPVHLFSADQLVKISELPTKVDCECPHHLVDLLEGLKAFERYSGDCVNKNDQDAALHDKIQRTTAVARHQLEKLLEEVLEVEGIEI